MTTILDRVSKETHLLVMFTNGEGIQRYTDSLLPIGAPAGKFDILEPHMNVTLPPRSGSLDNKECVIELPFRAAQFTDYVSSGRPYPITEVKVWEHTRSGGLSEVHLHFLGRMTRAVKNQEEGADTVKIVAKDLKAMMQAPLGLLVTHQCPWTFGKNGCFKAFTGLTESAVIDRIDGVKVTVRALNGNYTDKRHFIDGQMTVNGLPLRIREWEPITRPLEFHLIRTPPTRWLGDVALIEPGCSKFVEECETMWLNNLQFGGIGFAIPEYNPTIEEA